jgi:hypothetical protein
MQASIKTTLKAIRRQRGLPANLRGEAIRLENKFDAAKWDQLHKSIRSFCRGASVPEVPQRNRTSGGLLNSEKQKQLEKRGLPPNRRARTYAGAGFPGAAQSRLEVRRLVFPDETWASSNMRPTRGRSPRGTRCLGHAPYGHWHTTTFVCALRTPDWGAFRPRWRDQWRGLPCPGTTDTGPGVAARRHRGEGQSCRAHGRWHCHRLRLAARPICRQRMRTIHPAFRLFPVRMKSLWPEPAWPSRCAMRAGRRSAPCWRTRRSCRVPERKKSTTVSPPNSVPVRQPATRAAERYRRAWRKALDMRW